MPNVNIQAPPNLNAPYYEELLDAGINDWGGISPLTPDYINPEKPWPHLEQLRLRTEGKGFQLRQRLPVYPEFLPAIMPKAGLLSARLENAATAKVSPGKRGPHDLRSHRRHGRRKVRRWAAASDSAGRNHARCQYGR